MPDRVSVVRQPAPWIGPVARLFDTSMFDRVRSIRLDGVRVVDGVLEPIGRLEHLETLRIHTGRVTPVGVARLARRRPDLDVRVTDVRLDLAESFRATVQRQP